MPNHGYEDIPDQWERNLVINTAAANSPLFRIGSSTGVDAMRIDQGAYFIIGNPPLRVLLRYALRRIFG